MLDLIDDGTLDTVFRCPDCGAVERFDSLSEFRDESGALSDEGVEYATELHADDCEPLRLIVGAQGFIYRGDDTDADVERLRALLDADGDVTATLDEASDILGGFGVEYVGVPGSRELAYVNNGDTYNATLGWDGSAYVVTSWGDWFEKAERAHEEESGERRCMYCGEWGEPESLTSGEFDCPHCGNEV